jgi:hypothetical protein
LIGTEYGEPSEFADGGVHATRGGYLLMPDGSPVPGRFLCANQNATVSGDAVGLHIEIPGARVLGACPGGTPVAGQVELCAEYNKSECTQPISGSIDSTPFEDSYMGSWGIGGDGLFSTETENLRGTRIEVDLDRPPLRDPVGQVIGGYVTTDPGGPHGGAIYCIGGGTFNYVDGGATRLTLTSFTKLGTCTLTGSGSDYLSICIPASPR